MKQIYKKIVNALANNTDKVLHFVVCLVLTLYLSIILPIHASAVIVLLVGVVKEWCDSRKKGNHWCWWDIFADTLGIATAIVPLLLS